MADDTRVRPVLSSVLRADRSQARAVVWTAPRLFRTALLMSVAWLSVALSLPLTTVGSDFVVADGVPTGASWPSDDRWWPYVAGFLLVALVIPAVVAERYVRRLSPVRDRERPSALWALAWRGAAVGALVLAGSAATQAGFGLDSRSGIPLATGVLIGAAGSTWTTGELAALHLSRLARSVELATVEPLPSPRRVLAGVAGLGLVAPVMVVAVVVQLLPVTAYSVVTDDTGLRWETRRLYAPVGDVTFVATADGTTHAAYGRVAASANRFAEATTLGDGSLHSCGRRGCAAVGTQQRFGPPVVAEQGGEAVLVQWDGSPEWTAEHGTVALTVDRLDPDAIANVPGARRAADTFAEAEQWRAPLSVLAGPDRVVLSEVPLGDVPALAVGTGEDGRPVARVVPGPAIALPTVRAAGNGDVLAVASSWPGEVVLDSNGTTLLPAQDLTVRVCRDVECQTPEVVTIDGSLDRTGQEWLDLVDVAVAADGRVFVLVKEGDAGALRLLAIGGDEVVEWTVPSLEVPAEGDLDPAGARRVVVSPAGVVWILTRVESGPVGSESAETREALLRCADGECLPDELVDLGPERRAADLALDGEVPVFLSATWPPGWPGDVTGDTRTHTVEIAACTDQWCSELSSAVLLSQSRTVENDLGPLPAWWGDVALDIVDDRAVVSAGSLVLRCTDARCGAGGG